MNYTKPSDVTTIPKQQGNGLSLTGDFELTNTGATNNSLATV